MKTFDELKLANPIVQAISNMGFEEPTPIQEMTIPTAMMGRDLIGQAQTGTGKTAAYGIPLVVLSEAPPIPLKSIDNLKGQKRSPRPKPGSSRRPRSTR